MKYLVLLLLCVGCATGPHKVDIVGPQEVEIPDTWAAQAAESEEVAEGPHMNCMGLGLVYGVNLKVNLLLWPSWSCKGPHKYLTCGLTLAQACENGSWSQKLNLDNADFRKTQAAK